jgi:hypothetical protein
MKKYPAVKKVLTVKKKEIMSTQQSSMEKQEAETKKKKEIRRMEQGGKKDTKRRTPYGLSYASCNPPKIGAKPTWPQKDMENIVETLLRRK